MTEFDKLAELVDDPEIRLLIFALAHSGHAIVGGAAGPARLRALVVRLLEYVAADQRRSWLSTDSQNLRMTTLEVRPAFGDQLVADVATFVRESSGNVAWQLAAVLPDLVMPRARTDFQ